ncbi:insulinase family protein [Streptomyces netropsis]|uniref:M16 family metallopeptidase n=1 Tax=Streptomyces netropsis TaxID=55404 RepID=UPI0030D2DBB8
MTESRGHSALCRFTLPNGLRVLLEPQPGVPRAAVSVHYGVGFRSEPPGREGFAHLFEHLMFRGSASLPDGRFYDHVHRLGGQANGTTHQEYTDYYQVAPASALEQALFAEADRMRAPTFTPEALAEQLDGVAEEIHQAVAGRPYGGFPWPLLPGVLFRSFANAHDGYGDAERLRQTTPADCVEFFDAYYAPGNAVLTVVGSVDPVHTRALIERHFGDIPARPVAPVPSLHEPLPTADRWATCTEPGVPGTALALGYRLPDPEQDLPGYLAHTVLARLMSRHGGAALRLPAVSAGCGFFGPLDAKDPDALVVTAVLPAGTRPEDAVRAVGEQWAAWAADPGLPDAVARTASALVSEHHRAHADIQTRSRALGRLEILFGRAELLDELPVLLAGLDPRRVAEAARSLSSAPKAVLVMEPGEVRTRPRRTEAEPAARPAAAVRAPGATEGPRPVPGPGPQPAPAHAGLRDTVIPGGLRVVAVADRRAPLVELRLRLPLGVQGWSRPGQSAALLRALAAHSRAAVRAAGLGGSFELSTDGEWADVTGYVPATGIERWLELLVEVLTGARGVPSWPAAVVRTPDEALDDAVRSRWLDARFRSGQLGSDAAFLAPVGGSLVAVGDFDPEGFADIVARALSSWQGGFEHLSDVAWPARSDVSSMSGEPLVLRDARQTDVQLIVGTVESAGAGEEAARFLATAVFGGWFRARLADRFAHRTAAGFELYAGRDTVVGTPRAYVRGRVPVGLEEEALSGIHAELVRLAEVPVGAAELDPARDFCAAQLLGAFDSPEAHADLLRRAVGAGGDPLELFGLSERLRTVSADEVAKAAVELFPVGAFGAAGESVGGPSVVLVRP